MRLHPLALVAFLSLPASSLAAAQGCPNDDLYSPNHTCNSAQQFGTTVQLFEVDLVARDGAPDYFFIPNDPGSELYVRVEFLHSEGNIDLDLFRDVGCGLNQPSQSSNGTGDFEVVEASSQFDHFVKVTRVGGPGDCSSYRLWIMQERNSTLGGNICAGGTNSTGWTATLSAFGSLDVSVNSFSLGTDLLPLNSFGYYLNSRGVGFLQPAGSEGSLCINSGGIGRFIRPGEIQDSAQSGSTTLSIDLTDIPRPTSTVSAVAGERFAFQYWYRDTAGSGLPVSNFSGAVMVWFD